MLPSSSVTYLRLDGSVEPEKRFDIVKAFNSDPTIDALLLTTHGSIFFLLPKGKKLTYCNLTLYRCMQLVGLV